MRTGIATLIYYTKLGLIRVGLTNLDTGFSLY
jgi:hypothetical protein